MAYKVFIGWDAREKVAYDVCRHSLQRHTRQKVDIRALKHRDLRKEGLFRRPWLIESETGGYIDMLDNRPFSTEFSHTRFLVPELCGFQGWALFMDSDMIWRGDVKDLFALCNDKYAAMVVKHNHRPKDGVKMDDRKQYAYHRKNWSSFVLWNCGHPANKGLTMQEVSFKPGAWLHGFDWLPDNLIGGLPFEYNWIESTSPSALTPKVIHYTEGGPWFEGMGDVLFADLWQEEYEHWQREGDYISDVPSTRYEWKDEIKFKTKKEIPL